mmetsp:Transcript_13972/g.30569  ORF Transcript_13972/g.30569 Transcript_13972/m.30569 type:complete len:480 (+) Transcript_13972:74-1513(+)
MALLDEAQSVTHAAALSVGMAKQQANRVDVAKQRSIENRSRESFSKKNVGAHREQKHPHRQKAGLVRNVSCLFRRSRKNDAYAEDVCLENFDSKAKSLARSPVLQRTIRASRRGVRSFATEKGSPEKPMKSGHSAIGFDLDRSRAEHSGIHILSPLGTKKKSTFNARGFREASWTRRFARNRSGKYHEKPTQGSGNSSDFFRRHNSRPLGEIKTKAAQVETLSPPILPSLSSTVGHTEATSQKSSLLSAAANNDLISSGSLRCVDSMLSEEDLDMSVECESIDSILESMPIIQRLQRNHSAASDITDNSGMTNVNEVTDSNEILDTEENDIHAYGQFARNLQIDAKSSTEAYPEVEVSLPQFNVGAIEPRPANFPALSPCKSISETLGYFQSTCAGMIPDIGLDTWKIPRPGNFPIIESLLPIKDAESESTNEELDSQSYSSNESDDLYHRLVKDRSIEHDVPDTQPKRRKHRRLGSSQ